MTPTYYFELSIIFKNILNDNIIYLTSLKLLTIFVKTQNMFHLIIYLLEK